MPNFRTVMTIVVVVALAEVLGILSMVRGLASQITGGLTGGNGNGK